MLWPGKRIFFKILQRTWNWLEEIPSYVIIEGVEASALENVQVSYELVNITEANNEEVENAFSLSVSSSDEVPSGLAVTAWLLHEGNIFATKLMSYDDGIGQFTTVFKNQYKQHDEFI